MKLIGPVAWRKVFLFIDPLIRLAVTCNWLIRGSALALFRFCASGWQHAPGVSLAVAPAQAQAACRLLILTVMGPDATVIAGMRSVSVSPIRFLTAAPQFSEWLRGFSGV
ncbi:hypothetical protein PQR71_11950 [Paraburkholderia fungorum]|uniref:hypothetical protein n=1 Tax=Paraburkholderia fungorum TaxID=134537 RepID=UPI0038B838A7